MHAIQKVRHRDYELTVGAIKCADGVIRVSAACEGEGRVRRSFRFSSPAESVDEACSRAIRDLCSVLDADRRS